MRQEKEEEEDAYTRQQLLGEEWWTSAFLALMRPGRDNTELAKGRRLVERGQVVIRGIFPGGVEAVVLGAVGGSRKVSLWFNDLEDDWGVLFRIFTVRQDLFSRLIAGEFTQELNEHLIQAGIVVIPSTLMDLDYRCDCESDHHTCSHIVATYLALGKYINDDPMTLFLFRGKTREEIICGVADAANICHDTEEEDPGSQREMAEEKNPPAPDQYYSPGPELDTIKIRSGYQPGKEEDIIRFLGRSPFRLGNTDLADLIAESYPKAVRYLKKMSTTDSSASEKLE